MPPKPLKQSLKDEARYALSDIRAAWERAWFGQPVTPSNWQTSISDALNAAAPAEDTRRSVYGIDPEADLQERCRAFFSAMPAAEAEERQPERRVPETPERIEPDNER